MIDLTKYFRGSVAQCRRNKKNQSQLKYISCNQFTARLFIQGKSWFHWILIKKYDDQYYGYYYSTLCHVIIRKVVDQTS